MTRTAEHKAHLRINQSRTRVAGTNYVVDSGTGNMGAEKYGAVGGAPTSLANILADPLIADLALSLAMPEGKIREIVFEMGRVIQRRALAGEPSGIPFVGTICVRQQHLSPEWLAQRREKCRRRLAKLKAKKAAGGVGWKTLTIDRLIAGAETSLANSYPIVNSLALHLPMMLRRFYTQNAAYTAHVKDHARVVREQRAAARGGLKADDGLQLRRRIKLARKGYPAPPKEDYEHPNEPVRRRYAVA